MQAVVPIIIALCGFGPATAKNDSPDALIARMTSEKAEAKDRFAAEDALAKLPPGVVLPKLLPLVAKGMPKGGIYNSHGDRELDHKHKAPIQWQVYYAVSRVWALQLKSLPDDKAAGTLVSLLRTTHDRGKTLVLMALASRWGPNAEIEVAKALRDPRELDEVRQAAAQALILHGKENYHEVLLKVAREAGPDETHRWFNLLVDPHHKKRRGVDPRVIAFGFGLIQAARTKTPDNPHAGYFLAQYLADYVGEKFAPDTGDPQYRDKGGGLKETFFAETVRRALRWWEENREKVEMKIGSEP